MKSQQQTKRLAVLETEAHAEEIRALCSGQDRVEYTYRTPGRLPSAFATSVQQGSDWENYRPLEAKPAAPPWVAYSPSWQAGRGKFCALEGLGHAHLRLLAARRPY